MWAFLGLPYVIRVFSWGGRREISAPLRVRRYRAARGGEVAPGEERRGMIRPSMMYCIFFSTVRIFWCRIFLQV